MMETLRFITIAIVILSYIENACCQSDSNETQNGMLSVDLIGSGFHRELKYIVLFPREHGSNRAFRIHQSFPPSVYVDMDQLQDLHRRGKLNIHYQRYYINTEKTTTESEEFGIDIYGNAESLATIHMPIHFRYHDPIGNISFVNVSIDFPKLYLKYYPEIGPLHVLTDKERAAIDLSPCENSPKRLCKWSPIDYDNHSRKPITANIPVGNPDQLGLVQIMTIGLSYFAGLFIFSGLYVQMRGLMPRITARLEKNQ